MRRHQRVIEALAWLGGLALLAALCASQCHAGDTAGDGDTGSHEAETAPETEHETERIGEPLLRIWIPAQHPQTGRTGCATCDQFYADFSSDSGGLATSLAACEVCIIPSRANPLLGIPAVPLFQLTSGGRYLTVIGYNGPGDLLARLELAADARESQPAPAMPGATVGDVAGLAKEIARLQFQLAEHGQQFEQDADQLHRLNEFAGAAAGEIEQLTAGTGQLRSEHATLIGQLAERLETVTDHPAADIALSIGQFAALSAGIGASGGAVALIPAALGALRRIRGRRRRRAANQFDPEPDRDTEPTIVPQIHVAEVDVDRFREAYVWASKALLEKYPGHTGTIDTLQSFIDQFLAAPQDA